MQETLAEAIEVGAFQASEKQRQRLGLIATNVIATQVAEKHQETLDLSIRKTLAEMKKDPEEQRHLLEGVMSKMTSRQRLKNMGAWRPTSVGRGNRWNPCQLKNFSRNCSFQETKKLQGNGNRAEPKELSLIPPCHQRPAYPPRVGTLDGMTTTDLRREQRNDPTLSHVINLLESARVRPPWESVSSLSLP